MFFFLPRFFFVICLIILGAIWGVAFLLKPLSVMDKTIKPSNKPEMNVIS